MELTTTTTELQCFDCSLYKEQIIILKHVIREAHRLSRSLVSEIEGLLSTIVETREMLHVANHCAPQPTNKLL